MKKNKTRFPFVSRLIIPAIIVSAFLSGTALADPDPDIFDGTRFPADPKPNFSLGKILKNVKLGLPGIPKSGSGSGSGSQDSMGNSQSGLPGIGGGAGGMQGQEGMPPMPGMSGGQGDPMGEMEGDPMQKGGGAGSDVEFGSESDKIGAGKGDGEYPDALGGESDGEGKPSDVEIGDRSEMIRGEAAEVQEALGGEEDGSQGRTMNQTQMPSGDQSGGRSTGVERGETMPGNM